MKKNLFYWAALLLSMVSPAINGQELYQLPPEEIDDVVKAPASPVMRFHPHSRRMILLVQQAGLSIDELAKPELRLAGLRINPLTNGPSRQTYITQLHTKLIQEGAVRAIGGLPAGCRITDVKWSPNGQYIAFLQHLPERIYLWVADLRTAQARQLTTRAVNAVAGPAFEWLPDSQRLLVKMLPASRLPLPTQDSRISGPVVLQNEGSRKPSRTYQDLLKNTTDEKILAHYLQSQLMLVDLLGRERLCGSAGLFITASVSPNGQYIVTKTLNQPFSYTLPYQRFASTIAVMSVQTGAVLTELARLPVADQAALGRDAVSTGPRQVDWRSDHPATLCWFEALDRGNPKTEVAIRDRIMTLRAPFSESAQEIGQSGFRLTDIYWGNDSTALVTERWWTSRRRIWRRLAPNDPTRSDTLFNYSTENRQADPGEPELRRNERGKLCLDLNAQNQLVFSGSRAGAITEVPFVDIIDLTSRTRTNLWISQAPYFEYPAGILDPDKLLLIFSRESPDVPPNYWCRDLLNKTEYCLTEFANPYPKFTRLERIPLRYDRSDGIALTADLWISTENKNKRLPTLLWAYPTEFQNRQYASQSAASPYRFKTYSDLPTLWAMRNYAVLTNVSFPIVADSGRQANDRYLEQLLMNARSVLTAAHHTGYVDTARVAVMGHSYGAFMVANLLTHSNLFKVGIALSGSYNRSLTPFGFQSEERTLWEAPALYNRLSPFLWADKVRVPLLLVHGQADNNPGTHYLQSERYFAALQGLGKVARFVTLPYESHSYTATESVLHVCYEIDQWLTTYLK